MNRYKRQILLPQVGYSGQQALKRSKVLLVGAGGLGLPCAQSLVAAGVGHMTIIDDDRVSLSNLQRQFLYHEADIDRYKVEVLRERLSLQNSEVKICDIAERFGIHNASYLIEEHDLIIDGSDNFETKFLINDVCLVKNKPWIYGSVSHFEGQLAVFSSTDSELNSCYRCLYEKLPVSKIDNCAEQGVFGAITGIIGNHQALEALKILININRKKNDHLNEINSLTSKTGVLQIFDFLSLEQQSLLIPKRKSCLCEKPELIQIKEEVSSACIAGAEKSWNAFVADSNKKILFDVRTLEEYLMGHHELAQIWGPDTAHQLTHAVKHATSSYSENIYLYCTSGKRAKEKCIELRTLGVTAYYIQDFIDCD